MNRSFLDGSFVMVFGLLAGVLCGAGAGAGLGALCGFRKETLYLVVAAFAAQGALVGAVVGGTRDIMGAIRDAFPNPRGPEADYRDPPATR